MKLAGKKVVSMALILCGISVHSYAVDRSRLWLPTSYKHYFAKLRKAAQLAEEKAPRCTEIIDGSLQQKLSTPEQPVFRLICRDENRRSHAMNIDGLTLEVVDLDRPGGRVNFEQLEAERLQAIKDEELRLADEARLKELQQQKDLWADCQQQVAKKTKNMRAMTVLTEEMPVADGSKEGVTTFLLDFNAEDIYGNPLRYRAACNYRSLEDFTVKIRPRKDS